ncbi:hypothetical protein DPSP01_009995 [Paraphaeosphaeria sporulosa]|uniref:Uncharacterized protein n=1 Tax=Paraphaeosphaeria sporulosa TaxID=1460663 RepID=A0A177CEC2_9PLEO|nr:uncharacterized protein CC84DRAFT_1205624 [Paraphaeosphaeria sporulosa]OAG05975.1 hypothetical protein CC84DRAFT_1205624 [Paraphaeosphaeria sporulosa]
MSDIHRQDSAQREPIIKRPSRTGSWDRAIVYDLESGKVDIRKKQDIEKDRTTGVNEYQPIQLTKRKNSISLYIGQSNGDKLRTDARSENDKFLARLSLDHMGFMNRLLLALGFITTLWLIGGDDLIMIVSHYDGISHT